MGILNPEDVMRALSQQFHYHYLTPAEVANPTELPVASQPFGEIAERFRLLRAKIIEGFPNRQEGVIIAVTGASEGCGKSFVAANLALTFSQLGQKTLLIDANLRRPSLNRIFNCADVSNGLSTILSGRSSVNVTRPLPSIPSLYLMPAGVVPPNPVELIQGLAFDSLTIEVAKKFDWVIVDTPAMSMASEATIIGQKCRNSIMVVRNEVDRVEELDALAKALTRCEAKLLAVVDNDPT